MTDTFTVAITEHGTYDIYLEGDLYTELPNAQALREFAIDFKYGVMEHREYHQGG